MPRIAKLGKMGDLWFLNLMKPNPDIISDLVQGMFGSDRLFADLVKGDLMSALENIYYSTSCIIEDEETAKLMLFEHFNESSQDYTEVSRYRRTDYRDGLLSAYCLIEELYPVLKGMIQRDEQNSAKFFQKWSQLFLAAGWALNSQFAMASDVVKEPGSALENQIKSGRTRVEQIVWYELSKQRINAIKLSEQENSDKINLQSKLPNKAVGFLIFEHIVNLIKVGAEDYSGWPEDWYRGILSPMGKKILNQEINKDEATPIAYPEKIENPSKLFSSLINERNKKVGLGNMAKLIGVCNERFFIPELAGEIC